MRALFGPDFDTIADEQDVAEFQRGYVTLCEEHRRILIVLLPKLAALQERGDSAGALRLIAEVKRLVAGAEPALH